MGGAPPATRNSSEVAYALNQHSLRVAFKFGQSLYFALQRKMIKPPIARLPANELDFLNHPSGETDGSYEAKVK